MVLLVKLEVVMLKPEGNPKAAQHGHLNGLTLIYLVMSEGVPLLYPAVIQRYARAHSSSYSSISRA